MTTLLRIDASTRIKGSHSRRLADYYQTQWLKTHPQGKIILRDLALNPVPHLTHEMIEAFQAEGKSSSPATALSHVLIQELRAADHLLIGSPMYNLALPLIEWVKSLEYPLWIEIKPTQVEVNRI